LGKEAKGPLTVWPTAQKNPKIFAVLFFPYSKMKESKMDTDLFYHLTVGFVTTMLGTQPANPRLYND
jgi:hypothetical protein